MIQPNCHCGSGKPFQECCEPFIKGAQKAPTAETLMRSRYAAYVIHSADYLLATTHVSQRRNYSKTDILDWATSNKWTKLEVLKATNNTVEFKAYFTDSNSSPQIHHEKSSFKLENGSWFYVDGTFFD